MSGTDRDGGIVFSFFRQEAAQWVTERKDRHGLPKVFTVTEFQRRELVRFVCLHQSQVGLFISPYDLRLLDGLVFLTRREDKCDFAARSGLLDDMRVRNKIAIASDTKGGTPGHS